MHTGKTTLELTSGGKFLESLQLFKNYPYQQAIKPWEVLSKRYAQSASGQITAFVENASPTSVFARIEYPVLLKNINVTDILFYPIFEQSRQISILK